MTAIRPVACCNRMFCWYLSLLPFLWPDAETVTGPGSGFPWLRPRQRHSSCLRQRWNTFPGQYRPIPVNTYNTYHMYKTYKNIQIPINADHFLQYIHTYLHISIHVVHAKTQWYMSIQTNTYQYIQYKPYVQSIQINTDQGHYMQYMPVHTNTYNTRWYTHVPSNTDQYYLSIYTIHAICTIHTNTYKYLSIQTIAYNTYIYIHINTNNTCQYISIQTNIYKYIHWHTYHMYNTYNYISIQAIPAHIKCQCMPIHTKTCNTYQKQHIPIHTTIHTIQYMPMNTTKQTTIHTNTYHEVQYLPCLKTHTSL